MDRETAMRILEGLARFLFTEEGDLKLLKGSESPVRGGRI